MRHLALVSSCVVLPVVLGCPGDLPKEFTEDGGTTVSDSGTPDSGTPSGYVCPSANLHVKADLVVKRCGNAGCHDAQFPSNGLDLVSPNVAARVVGKPSTCMSKVLVDSTGGYLIEKVNPSPTCGTQMPQTPPLLTATEIQCLTEWAQNLANGGNE